MPNPAPALPQDTEIQQLATRVVYENPWMTVNEDQIRRSDGGLGIYGVVHKPDFAVIVPYENGGVHLVEQFRYPVGQRLWELPQGSWGDPGHTEPLQVAAEELREETGLAAGRLTTLGFLYEAYGYCDQGFHVVLAEDLLPGPQRLEAEEVGLRTAFFPIADVWDLVRDGRLRDAPTVAALSLFERALAARVGE